MNSASDLGLCGGEFGLCIGDLGLSFIIDQLHDGHLCDTSVSSEVVLSEDDAKTNDPYNINNFCTIQRT